MAKVAPVEFFQQVRQEISKVTWPTRKETMVTTGMVFVMVIVLLDLLSRWSTAFWPRACDLLLGIGG